MPLPLTKHLQIPFHPKKSVAVFAGGFGEDVELNKVFYQIVGRFVTYVTDVDNLLYAYSGILQQTVKQCYSRR